MFLDDNESSKSQGKKPFILPEYIDIKVGSMPHTWALGHVGLTALLSFFPLSGNMLLGSEEGYWQDLF